jgi:uncharacterized membrane protein YbhN (UPF0104 family)
MIVKEEKKYDENLDTPIIQINIPRRLTIILTAIALGIMVYFFHQIGIDDIVDSITTANLALVLFSITLYLLTKFLDSLGWGEILKIMEIKPSCISLYRVHITSLAASIEMQRLRRFYHL